MIDSTQAVDVEEVEVKPSILPILGIGIAATLLGIAVAKKG